MLAARKMIETAVATPPAHAVSGTLDAQALPADAGPAVALQRALALHFQAPLAGGLPVRTGAVAADRIERVSRAMGPALLAATIAALAAWIA